MKKLLITTMAAVSVGLCAKADDTGFISGTSFETVPVGSYLATNGQTTVCKWFDENGDVWSDNRSDDPEKGYCYWVTEATDAQLVVSNLSSFAGDYLLNADRPKEWIDESNTKALYIDTDKPLMRYVNYSADDFKCTGEVLNNEIFIDSVVQFTATDVPAEPDSADKLRVWLYASPGNLDDGVFSEKDAVTNLVVTAGYYKPNDNSTYKTNYLTDVSIDPDSWHRLTIKTFVKEGYTKFNIYVDGEIVKVGDLQDFDSLIKEEGQNSLQCVAFDGKGAVDDIVFTTTDPFYVAPETPKEFFLTLAFRADEAAEATLLEVLADDGELGNGGNYKLNLGTENVIAWVACADGYKVSNNGATYNEGGYWIVPINVADATENGTVNVTITVEEVGGGSGEEPTTPTVEPGKPVECDSEEAAKKVTITVTDKDAEAAGQAAVIKAVVKQNGNKWVVTAEINTEATGYIPADTTLVEVAQKLTDIANATETDEDGNVTVALKDVTPGLYYSVDVSENLAEANQGFNPGTRTLATSAGQVTLKVSKPKGNSAFFKVVQHLTKE